MRLIGSIDIFGHLYKATVEISEPKETGATFVKSMGKWKAQRSVRGKTAFFGYYDTKADALEASRLQRNMTKQKRRAKAAGGGTYKPGAFSTGVTYDTRAHTWRIKMTVGEQRVSLGRYGTYGHAVLVRDVVARRTGKHVVVADYSMPLALVSDPVARSYITDRILPATADELAEYQRRVDELNGAASVQIAPPAPVTHGLTLPDELWRVRQPSRVGRSKFDTLDL